MAPAPALWMTARLHRWVTATNLDRAGFWNLAALRVPKAAAACTNMELVAFFARTEQLSLAVTECHKVFAPCTVAAFWFVLVLYYS